jgi:glycosyltransferase involved in cell wall biosynthesis
MRIKVMLLAVGLGVGGTETHLLELASGIDRSKFDVVVCSLKSGGCLVEELLHRGVRVVNLAGAGKFDVRVLFRFWKLIRQERPDVVQSFLFWANLSARLVRRLSKRVRVVCSYHDEIVSEGRLVRIIDRLTFRWSDGVVCCSDAVRRSVSACLGAPAARQTIIPFGIDVGRFAASDRATREELGLRVDGPIVGTVCRLVEPKKGLSVLLQSVALLKGRSGDSECQLLIVGEGPARASLEALSEELGLANRVRFAGARRDIPRILPLLDVFVLPSFYEGFGIAILEAMAAGKPVVATTVGGVPEFVAAGETGLLVEPGNPAAIAEAIACLLGDREQARQMGLRGRTRVAQQFQMTTVVRQHEQIYQACLAHA